MIKKIGLLGVLFILLACNKEEQKSIIPAYLHIDAMRVDANFSVYGTESDKITTAWVYVNDDILGAYELPIELPIAASGSTRIKVEAGMNLNGVKALRTPYPFYTIYNETINLVPEQTHYLNTANDSLPQTTYDNFLKFEVIEDFEGVGLGLESTEKSDTNIFKINANEGAFVFKNEPTTSGKVVLKSQSIFEASTIIDFPFVPVQNYYVELNYKSDIPFTVGVFMTTSSQTIQAPVVTVSPKEDWNKIYINLITELGATLPLTYKIFIGAINRESSTKEIFIDNLKLVY